jgi:hypothetical protein
MGSSFEWRIQPELWKEERFGCKRHTCFKQFVGFRSRFSALAALCAETGNCRAANPKADKTDRRKRPILAVEWAIVSRMAIYPKFAGQSDGHR